MCAHLFVRELETATLGFCSHSISYIVRAIHIERLEIKSTCILEAYDIKSIVHRNYLAEIRFFGCLHVSFHLLLPLLMPITTIKTAIMEKAEQGNHIGTAGDTAPSSVCPYTLPLYVVCMASYRLPFPVINGDENDNTMAALERNWRQRAAVTVTIRGIQELASTSSMANKLSLLVFPR
ncbi:uncharacterized protein LOC111267123 isoform X2 [Varroa jacobsoni]|uniref:uncharacterized protein LOC111267123 isoform X2 n=1 Tax=Varroa jacobsoni TaxID=62625 RepID=UPI000BF3B254|nr:uncharacterized protein LOC111267123 isoform X2 [Varroa jacobsoni]